MFAIFFELTGSQQNFHGLDNASATTQGEYSFLGLVFSVASKILDNHAAGARLTCRERVNNLFRVQCKFHLIRLSI